MLEISTDIIEKMEEGVNLINDQHQKIFNFTTDLFSHCVGNDEEENQYFGETIAAAAELVKIHFQTEEKLMLETKFPFYAYVEHKKEHEEFISTVVEYIKRFEMTGCVDLLTFASYAKWWVIGHIKRHDRKYINYFNEITRGKGIAQMHV